MALRTHLDVPLWSLSKQSFELSTWGGPDSDPWAQLQLRLAQWAQKVYGYEPFERAILGIGEELGELAEANAAGRRPKILDSIGDATNFAMKLCTTFRLDYGVLLRYTNNILNPYVHIPDIVLTSRFDRIALKTLDGTRGLSTTGEGWQRAREMVAVNVSDLAWHLSEWCDDLDLDYFDVVRTVAEQVMLRTANLPALAS